MQFALMPPAAQAVTAETEANPALPVFKRRWWYRDDRLDARPVIWSLYNRPDDWDSYLPTIKSTLKIKHQPSGHEIWTDWWMDYGISAGCSCSGRKWQPFQRAALGRAVRHWLSGYNERNGLGSAALDAQFASHFIR